MTRLQVCAVSAVLLAIAVFLNWQQQQGTKRLVAENAALREQVEQVAPLQKKNQRLTEQLKAGAASAQADVLELARLRAQATAMRQTAEENARLKSERDRLAKQVAQSSASEAKQAHELKQAHRREPPEERVFFAKSSLAKELFMSLKVAAGENDGHLSPELIATVVGRLEMRPEAAALGVKAEQFEINYKGSFPDGRIIVAHEKEPVQLANGKWTKIYVLENGSVYGLDVDTRDGFAAKEKALGFRRPNP